MKQKFKHIFLNVFWLALAIGTLVLFVAAMQHRKNEFCNNLVIKINHHDQSNFITQDEIAELINSRGKVERLPIKKINLSILERVIKKNPWVRNSEIYFENNNVLHVDIDQNEAIARLFTVNGNSYYLDENGERLPIKNNATTRVVVISNFPSDNVKLSVPDSILLAQVTNLANLITLDSFWKAQIAQINITNNGKFELIPTLGNETILFGDIQFAKEKFEKMKAFYTAAWIKNGVSTYETIDLRFNNQIVAKRKENRPITKDSLIILNNDTLRR
ncbi:MAG: cell division protein FtsQ/DivIB [Chitinophagaceae bacterium]|nr:cell division protein FtsQ/DivIB [Chitinophagaceae bacterium]